MTSLAFLAQYSVWPLFLIVQTTPFCNRACKPCVSQGKTRFYAEHFSGHLPADRFKEILISFRRKFWLKPHIHLFGGEPLCHPDFHLFLKYSQMYNYSPTLSTNGDFLAKYSELISKSSLTQLNISVNRLIEDDGIINSKFAEIIKIFMYQNRKKKVINLNYLIVPQTYRYVKDVIGYFNAHYVKGDFAYFTIQHLNMIEKDDIGAGGFNLKELADIIAGIKKLRLKFKLLFLPDIKSHDIEKYYSPGSVFGNRCFAPWVGLTIYPDLTVTPGGAALGCNFVLGNLLKESITEIWRGNRLRDFRLGLIKKGVPEICSRCCHKLYY